MATVTPGEGFLWNKAASAGDRNALTSSATSSLNPATHCNHRLNIHSSRPATHPVTLPDPGDAESGHAGVCRSAWLDHRHAGARGELRSGEATSSRKVNGSRRRREIDVVLVWRLDRWGRSVTDLLATLQELDPPAQPPYVFHRHIFAHSSVEEPKPNRSERSAWKIVFDSRAGHVPGSQQRAITEAGRCSVNKSRVTNSRRLMGNASNECRSFLGCVRLPGAGGYLRCG